MNEPKLNADVESVMTEAERLIQQLAGEGLGEECNDDLVPTDNEGVEDIDNNTEQSKDPELKPIMRSQLNQLLEHVRGQKIGFKFGDVYFQITGVDTRKGTFTAKPANKIFEDVVKKKPRNQRRKLSQQEKKKKRKK